jgi:hypothetical protein
MVHEFDKPFQQLPIIPPHVLKKHRVHEPLDTRFRSAARLLQALWRQRQRPLKQEGAIHHLSRRQDRSKS